MKTFALVLETNNLQGGGADATRIAAGLERLLSHLRQQTRPLERLDELVITHEGLDDAVAARLEHAAGRPIHWVRVAEGTDYYAAKNAGFDATRSDVVAFGDADCWPEPGWLEALLMPFESEGERVDAVQVVAGRTFYRPDTLGLAATTIDFMYFPSRFGAGFTRNFYANNVAIRRSVFERFRYAAGEDFYRGNCQTMGLRLHDAGIPIRFAPLARTTHRFPDSVGELLRLRLHRGADTVTLAPQLVHATLGVSVPPSLAAAVVLAGRLGCSVRALNRQDQPPVKGLRTLACVTTLTALSAIDAAGAMARAMGWRRAAQTVLSYHQDVDALAHRQPARARISATTSDFASA